MKSLYIHIPFCESKCYYCDFCSFKADDNIKNQYVTKLLCEIDNLPENITLKSVFIGGGTPSLLDIELVKQIFTKIKSKFLLCDNCEITIDSPDQIPVYLRNDSSYVETNRKAIKYAVREINGLTVNVPILDPQMDYKKIKKLVDEIAQIESKHISVNLIRLMNVGKMNHKDYPVIYLPEAFIESFKECAKGTRIKNIHIHCALRGKILGMQCNMLTEKLGIDCSGNVFSCIWGGYIKGYDRNNISDNPFYIGNLLQNSLSEVLEGKRAKELEKLIKTNPTSHCRVFCCGKGNLWLEDDPLFKL